MKKLLSIAVCVSAVAAFATEVPVSLGEVGVTAVSSSTTNTVIAVSYTDLASDGNITASNLVKTANLAEGDRLYVYDSGDFKAFVLAASGDVKYWQGTATAEPNDGVASVTAATSADGVRVAVGTGVWLVRGSGWDGTPFTFYIYGKPVDSLSPVTVSGGSALVGNPTQVSKAPTFTSGPTNGDQMIVPHANKLGAKIWKYSSSNSKWWVTPSETSATAPTIPAGTGFWYVGTATFNWD